MNTAFLLMAQYHGAAVIPLDAVAIIKSMQGTKKRIFPHSTDAISAAFTRAGKFLGVDDLHFHDLRHDGISRLFELGWTIPKVASVSGHRSWASLKRYTHIRQAGDKFKDWKWIGILTGAQTAPSQPPA